MSAHHKPAEHTEPIVDEWGFYDPDRAGLAAVMARLEARAATPTPRTWGTKRDDGVCNTVKTPFRL
jgi:hypothetical protein